MKYENWLPLGRVTGRKHTPLSGGEKQRGSRGVRRGLRRGGGARGEGEEGAVEVHRHTFTRWEYVYQAVLA